jgi:hypothetical protein
LIRVVVGGRSWVVPSLDTDEVPASCSSAMLKCYQAGDRPEITRDILTTTDLSAVLSVPTVETAQDTTAPTNVSTWTEQVTDHDAAKRIADLHATLIAGGVAVNDSEQLYATGTRMAAEGYATQHARKADHDRELPVKDAAHGLIARITAERREDIQMSAADFGKAISVNGRITVAGRALSEQAIRGLAARLESPMLGYVLGVRERNGTDKVTEEMRQADRNMVAEVLAHECKRNPDVALKLRTRNGARPDVFAVVSPSYSPADAPAVLGRLVDSLPADAKGTTVYDSKSTAWELRASVWTPTPVDLQSVGEPFKGYAALGGRDNGTGRVGGSGGIELLRCLNASTYAAESARVNRVHRGDVLGDVDAMINGAIASINVLVNAWGQARTVEIPMTDEERMESDKFMSALFMSLLKGNGELVGVLPGASKVHAAGLVKAYDGERRDFDRLVKADVGQAWTKYIQDQPGNIRQDAEQAIGRWMVAS